MPLIQLAIRRENEQQVRLVARCRRGMRTAANAVNSEGSQSLPVPSLSRLLLVGFLLLTLLTGCPQDRIDFEADTVVSPDGSVSRTARYIASGSNEEYEALVLDDGTRESRKTNKGELKANYALPDGGAWESHETTTYDENGKPSVESTQVYSVVGHYAPGAAISSDHVREGETEGHAIRNEIELEVHDYFFVRFFDFREVYRDTTGRQRLRAELARVYPAWKADLADALASRLDGVTTARASRVVNEIADPWYQKFMDRIYIEELHQFDAIELDEAFRSELIARLPPPSTEQTELWHELIDDAVDEPGKDTADEKFGDALDGVYEFCVLFCTHYGFTQTLSMPGTLESTNATSTQNGLLMWEFDSDDLLLQDFELEARSRLVDPARIIGTAIAGLLFVLGLAAFRVGRKRRTNFKQESC